jgi:hypothetical protein
VNERGALYTWGDAESAQLGHNSRFFPFLKKIVKGTIVCVCVCVSVCLSVCVRMCVCV